MRCWDLPDFSQMDSVVWSRSSIRLQECLCLPLLCWAQIQKWGHLSDCCCLLAAPVKGRGNALQLTHQLFQYLATSGWCFPWKTGTLCVSAIAQGLSHVFGLLSACGIVTYFLGLCRQSRSRSSAAHTFCRAGCAQVCRGGFVTEVLP